MRPPSLAWRVRVLAVCGVMLVVGISSFVAYERFRAAYRGQLDRLIEVMAEGVAATVTAARADDGGLEHAIAAITESPWRGRTTDWRIWLDGAPADLAASAEAEQRPWNLEAQGLPAIGEARFLDLADKKKRWRGVWLRREVPGGVLNVALAHPANYERRRLHELALWLAGLGGATIFLAALLAAPLARLTLLPLGRLAAAVGATSPEARAIAPLGAGDQPAEVEALARAIDALVARFRHAIERQRSLAGEAAHQLRTPLAVLRSTLELAQSRGVPTERTSGGIAEALEDVARMQRMVEQLVTLARVEAGSPDSTRVVLRLDALLEELAASFQREADRRGIEIACERLVPCEVQGDEAMLRLLFTSLIENALLYGPANETVRVGLELGPAGQCTATVTDAGGAIPSEALDRLFERFFRAEGTRASHASGAGLGLSIAREIARRHGGDVWVTSSPATRTTFHVRLPTDGPSRA